MDYRSILSDSKIDNDVSCHVTLGNFEKRLQEEKGYLTHRCSLADCAE